MTKHHNRLTARAVATIRRPGRHADGNCLYLKVTRTGQGVAKSWVLMYARGGRQREAGLGSASTVTLAQARAKAAEAGALLTKGVDPLARKKAATEADEARRTFGQVAAELLAAKASEWRNAKHRQQWRTTLEKYAAPLWAVPVDQVDTVAVLGVLKPLWQRAPETGSRLRGRIEAVLDFAKAHGLRSGENPAAWRGHLSHLLPKRAKLSRGHHAAMAYRDVPVFVAQLRASDSVHARALEFLVLTAGRSGEVLGARWDEIDMVTKVWTIPAARMKAGSEHRVPLSCAAMVILEQMAKIRTGTLVFAGQRRGRPLSGGWMGKLVPGSTVHGFRSAFRDWCGETTSYPREIAEQALAHATGNAVEQAYARSDLLEKRRTLMESWASFCAASAGGNVVLLRALVASDAAS